MKELIANIKSNVKKINFKNVIQQFIWAIISFILTSSEFIFVSYPFGFALCGVSVKNVTGIFIGAVIGAAISGYNALAYVLIIVVLYLARYFTSSGKFDEDVKKRLLFTLGASGLFAVESLLLMDVGATLMISSVFTILFTALFSFIYSFKYSNETKFLGFRNASDLALIFSIIYSLNEFEFFGFIPSVVAAYVITMLMAMKHGYTNGGITGIICGLAVGAQAVIYTPILGISGIIAGILFTFSDSLSIFSTLLISVIYGLYSTDVASVGEIIQNGIMAVIIFVPLTFILKRHRFFKNSGSDYREIYDYALPTFNTAGAVSERINKLSDTYKELSALFSNMSKHQMSPSANELGNIIKTAMCAACLKCPQSKECKSRRACLSAVVDLSKKYLQNCAEIPLSRSSRLPDECRDSEVISMINRKFKDLLETKAERDSCSEASENMLSISKALSSAVNEDSDYMPNPDIASKISQVLASMRIRYSGVYAQGKKGVKVYVYDVIPKDLKIGVKELSNIFSKECKIKFTDPVLSYENRSYTMTFSRAPRFNIDASYLQLSKENASICGDSVCDFTTPSAYYAVICDGMGSGAQAAATSRLSCLMINKLISSGSGIKISIDMINKLLLKKFDEVFTTLDIFSIDVYNGDGIICKAAASSSFIIRNDKKYEINSRSVPAGIVEEFNPEITKIKLLNNDIVVLMSDGALECFEKAENIVELALKEKEKSATEICKAISDFMSSSRRRNDDATVVVLKITKISHKARLKSGFYFVIY